METKNVKYIVTKIDLTKLFDPRNHVLGNWHLNPGSALKECKVLNELNREANIVYMVYCDK